MMKRLILLTCVVTLLLPASSWAVLAVDSRDQCTAAATSTLTKSFTVNNASPLIVSVSWISLTVTITSISWNGVNLGHVATRTGPNNPAENTAIYAEPNPGTGTHDVVVTFSAGTTVATCFIISTTGGDTTTATRSPYTRFTTDGTGPGLTVANSVNGDIVFHAATVNATTITFDGGEDSTTTEDDSMSGGSRSGGLSTIAATGANTVVGATDVVGYSEVAVAVIPAGAGGGAVLQSNQGFIGVIIGK